MLPGTVRAARALCSKIAGRSTASRSAAASFSSWSVARAASCSGAGADSEGSTAWRHAGAWSGGVATAAAAMFALAGMAACKEEEGASAGQTQKAQTSQQEYTREQVAEHGSRDSRVWVTYKDGVYDVTDFLDMHPGGSQRLMLAAGGAIDPFWAMYAQHKTAEVHNMLEGYRIGKLAGGGGSSQQVADPYANEPKRHPALVVRSQQPFNAETPADVLSTSKLTPNELFYVRNHLPVPHVDAATWTVSVEGEGMKRVNLSLKDLTTQFKKHTVAATLQCTGNRRDMFNEVKEVKGLEWAVGAIGTAEFSGARLCDVLAYAGLGEDTISDVEHIQFEGLDSDISGTCYGASIPVSKAMSRGDDVILAYEMNGSPLPLDHGFPVRVVVPGTTGARSVKWLSRIIASKEESGSHWQQKDYKSFSPSVGWEDVDWESAPAIQETPVQSAICVPKPGDVLEGPVDEIEVHGYAFSGGGQSIIRVDVSADGGATWTTAELEPVDRRRYRAWAWTLWHAVVPVPPEQSGSIRIQCKAVDSAYNTQPETAGPIWNLRGVLNNAWHDVAVTVA